MLTFALYLSSFLHLLSTTTTTTVVAAAPPYTPTDYFLLDCGAPSNETSSDGRNWDTDSGSKFSPANIATTTSALTASEQDPNLPSKVPYMTARIFHTQFTYTFPVSPGQKFVRFYFYPATYPGLNKTQSFFSVTVNNHTLMQNFSAFLAASDLRESSLIKEFVVNVRDTQRIEIIFSPSLNSYAFVNGIEVVSMPEKLYIGKSDYPYQFVGFDYFYYIDNNTSIETLYRLNVGGSSIGIADDTGMFRIWEQDESYVVGGNIGFTPHRDVPIHYSLATPAYIAPEVVYTTSRTMGNLSSSYNLTWSFSVDSGFHYLVRLHFCEIQLEVTLPNQRVFFILMNNQTAEQEADVINWSGGTGNPVFKDYIVQVLQMGDRRIKQDMWLMMYPNLNIKAQYKDAILNGLEMFKLNGSDGSLAGPNPELIVGPPSPPALNPKSHEKPKSSTAMLGGIIGGIIGGVFVIAVLGFMVFRRKRRVPKELEDLSKTKSSWVPISYAARSTKTVASSLPSDLCRHFSLAEIKSGTSNFDGNFVIGVGGFGNVYKGYIDDGSTTVAIKRLNSSSNQGAREFQTEILMLSKLRHLHLVSLIGYCDEDGEMILVYDYMAHGTLRDHLYRTTNPPLTWKQRLEICIGAARGLHYLHTGANHMIIHRDVKSTNILLDEKWVAKVADFGLSKIGPTDLSRNHVSTVVKGSFGYLDPEYYRRQQLTDKSDVYSFGVVLFEVLCARPAVLPTLPKQQVNLAEWGRYCYRKGTVDKIVDSNLRGQIAPECLKKFGEIAERCLRDQGIERPAIGDVVWSLEFALQLQEAAEKNINGVGHVMNANWAPLSTSDDDDNNELFSGSGEHVSGSKSSVTSTVTSDELKSGTVFSEIMNPKAR